MSTCVVIKVVTPHSLFRFDFPVLHFGDILNAADNSHTSRGDTIKIELLGQAPIESFRSELTINVLTMFWPSESTAPVSTDTSATATVIGGPQLQYRTSVSSRYCMLLL